MVNAAIAPVPVQQFFDANGVPLAGGKLFTYNAGTTTKLATFTDASGATANPNPIILDAQGSAQIWLTPLTAYKFVLSPATDTDPPTNPIWTADQIESAIPGSDGGGGGGGGVSLCPNSLLVTTTLGLTVDGNGSTPGTGICGDDYVPFACTIVSATIQANPSGSVVIDIWGAPFVVNSPPVVGNSIVNGNYPTLATAQSSQDTTLTGWDTSIVAGTALRYNIVSISTLTRFKLTFTCIGTVNFS